jgi:hypothetical protein
MSTITSSNRNTSTLHQRRPYSYTTPTMSSPPTSSPSSSSILRSTELTSSLLLKANPTYHSKVYKLKIPFIYTITPSFLLQILQFLCYPLAFLFNNSEYFQFKPYWVERYIILIGNYVYKFKPNGHGSMGTNNMRMKGSPIPLETMTTSTLVQSTNGIVSADQRNNNNTHHHNNRIEDIPIQKNSSGYFAITHNTKVTYYATSTQLDAQTWINTIRNARQECITTQMGHSKIPIRKEIEVLNCMGKRIVDQKQRISDLIRRREMEDIELTCLHGGGSSSALPRGYYG